MKRFFSLASLFVGLGIGFIGGAILTVAYGDDILYNYEQAVAQAGESKITRARMAERCIAKYGNQLLDGELRHAVIVEEIARRRNVTVSAVDVNKRIAEYGAFLEKVGQGKIFENTPKVFLFDQFRAVMLAEKCMGLTLSDEDIVGSYTNDKAKLFVKPAMVKLICVATDSMATATKALGRWKKGENPRLVAGQLNTDEALKQAEGDLEIWFSNQTIKPECADAIFGAKGGKGLRKGEYTEIIRSTNPKNGDKEYVLFYVYDYLPRYDPPLDEVRDAVIFNARVAKFNRDEKAWFDEASKGIEYLRVKNVLEPMAKPEKGFRPPAPITPSR